LVQEYAENLPIEVKFSDGTPRTAFPTDTIKQIDKLKFETLYNPQKCWYNKS